MRLENGEKELYTNKKRRKKEEEKKSFLCLHPCSPRTDENVKKKKEEGRNGRETER
jgi:hypothetical protein